MCSKVLNGHIILTDTSITTILAPEMTYTPVNIRKKFVPAAFGPFLNIFAEGMEIPGPSGRGFVGKRKCRKE